MDTEQPQKQVRIGIPRALLYYKYHVLWETFFKQLGCQVVLSPKTNKDILNAGISLCVDENCLPIKIFLGHVGYLQDKSDYIFVPRVASLATDEESCTKLLATYDIIHNTLPDVNIIEYNIDIKNKITEAKEFRRVGALLGEKAVLVKEAYEIARELQDKADCEVHDKQEAMVDAKSNNLRILIVSHPYNIEDELIGRPIISFLKAENVDIIYSDFFDKQEAVKLSENVSEKLYWTYSKELVGGLEYYRDKVDGIIFIVTFPCGPDSLVTELCSRKIKDIPMMTLILDELQGEAGLRTRLESFADIIKMKKAKSGSKTTKK